MIQRQSHSTIPVLDQESAKDFYTDKLGFEVRHDETMKEMGGFRWLTVGPKGQPDFEMILMPIVPSPMMDESTVKQIRELVKKGAFGCGVLETDDCRKTYRELKEKGVEFMAEPSERPYGVEALFKDDSGNWFSLCQRRS